MNPDRTHGYLRNPSRGALVLVAVAVLIDTGCSRDYVSGKPTFNLIDEQSEIEIGAEQDPLVVAEYGLYDDHDLAQFVDGIGQRLARVSHRPQLRYTFRVIDTPMVNAFALPGGYIYVTRGVLAHMQSEDQLVAVMGHEVGHVVARHSVKQMSRKVASTGFGLTTAIGKILPGVRNVLEAPFDVVLLKYGRDQELQSDKLGVEYATALGYDARALAGFFQLLDRMEQQSDGESPPAFLSTHPNPGERSDKVIQLATEEQASGKYQPRHDDAHVFLKRLDGLVYGVNPRHGFIRHTTFYHPDLAIKMPVPVGWEVRNSASQLLFFDPDQVAIIQLLAVGPGSAQAGADDLAADEGVEVLSRGKIRLERFDVYRVEATTGSGDNDFRIVSYFIQKDNDVLLLNGFVLESEYARLQDVVVSTLNGFSSLVDPAVLALQPARVRIRPAPISGPLKTVFASMKIDDDFWLEYANLNGKTLEDSVSVGDWLKVVE